VVSSGEDGLICVFDTAVRGEEDALSSVLSAGSSIARFGFFGPKSAFVYCLTRTETFSLWNIGSADRVARFDDVRDTVRAVGFLFTTTVCDCPLANPRWEPVA
jgi:WD repeat-containing protein 89